MWLKEGLPSLICSTCIERLRVAYDFKNICLQSDHTLLRYISHLQDDDSKDNSEARSLATPTKFDFAITTESEENIPISIEEPQNAEYLHLKHFLDNDEDLVKTDDTIARSNTASPNSPSATGI